MFIEQLKRVLNFFTPANLKNLSVKKPIPLKSLDPETLKRLAIRHKEEIALVVIDVQEEFCDPNSPHKNGNSRTKAIAEQISTLVPEFRKAGIPVYALYYADKELATDKIDFYKFKPDEKDIILSKRTDSAFRSGNFEKRLRKDGRKLLLTCGFNLSACVERTIDDACKKGYSVCLLEDMSGNGRDDDAIQGNGKDRYLKISLRSLRKKGVLIANAQQVLPALQRAFGG